MTLNSGIVHFTKLVNMKVTLLSLKVASLGLFLEHSELNDWWGRSITYVSTISTTVRTNHFWIPFVFVKDTSLSRQKGHTSVRPKGDTSLSRQKGHLTIKAKGTPGCQGKMYTSLSRQKEHLSVISLLGWRNDVPSLILNNIMEGGLVWCHPRKPVLSVMTYVAPCCQDKWATLLSGQTGHLAVRTNRPPCCQDKCATLLSEQMTTLLSRQKGNSTVCEKGTPCYQGKRDIHKD